MFTVFIQAFLETTLIFVLLGILALAAIAAVVWYVLRTGSPKGHVIVIGLSRPGRQVALSLAKAGRKVVVLSDEPSNPDAALIRQRGGTVYTGTGFDEALIRQAGLAHAAIVFIATDNDDANIKLAHFISGLRKRQRSNQPLRIMLQIGDEELESFVEDYLDVSGQTMVDVQTFNMDSITAQYVYDQFPPHQYLIDSTAKNTEKIICVIGSNATAKAFVIENSILSQYGDAGNLKIFLITERAETFLKSIKKQYPNIESFVNLVPIELLNERFSGKLDWDLKFTGAIQSIDAVYFFGDRDPALINSAIHLRQFLYDKTENIRAIPIIVCLPEATKVLSMLDEENQFTKRQTLGEKLKEQVVIHLVRKYSDTCTVKRMVDGLEEKEILAKIVNYYYAVKYEFDGLLFTHFKKSGNSELLKRLDAGIIGFKVKKGDPLAQIEQMVVDFIKEYTKNSADKVRSIFGIHVLWNNLTDRKKDSNRYLARHLDIKLFILKERGVKKLDKETLSAHVKFLAPIEHKRWTAEKLAFNFSYGKLPATDKNLKKILKDTLKIHDQLVPFDKLNAVNQDKDLDMFFLIPLMQKIKENI
ncbi:MAG: hypothetical protein K0S33_1757 [Bacteroidetes bacterium]|jgi:hypothetical protein|nr:hypothetical protein [Bacteroidota bacterium]